MIQIDSVYPSISGESKERAKAAWVEFGRNPEAFWDLPEQESLWQAVAHRAEHLSEAEQVVVVGIGGSSLGARVLVAAGESPSRILFLENSDPLSAERIWQALGDLTSTHWLWISKSGNTLETLAHLTWVNERFIRQGLSLARQSTVISDPGQNPLTRWADQHQVHRLVIPPGVGGRFSALTGVGLLPAACAGVDLDAVRGGAQWAKDQNDLIIDLSASALDGWQRGEWITLFWAYSEGLKTFSAWFQQLWAESLAKKISRSGHAAPRVSFPVPALGAVDQHSILQQVVEGARDKSIWLSRVTDLEMRGPRLDSFLEHIDYLSGVTLGEVFAAQAKGTVESLRDEKISTLVLRWRDHGPETLAGAMILMEAVIACLGQTMDINAFDQPGVEAGKVRTLQILRNTIAART